MEAYGSGIPRVRALCEEAGIRIEYVRMADGTKFVFHRNDAFGDATDQATDQATDHVGDGVGENGTDVGENAPRVTSSN